MKSKIPTKAYGGATEAQRKQNGLGLPRTWKVMTSTLLLLFTLAIGQMWAAEETITWDGTSLTGVSSTNITAGTALAVAGSDGRKVQTIEVYNSAQIASGGTTRKKYNDGWWENFYSTPCTTSGCTDASTTARIEIPFTIGASKTFEITNVSFDFAQNGGSGPAVHAFLVQGTTEEWLGYKSTSGTCNYTPTDITFESGEAKLVFVLGIGANKLGDNRGFLFSNISITGDVEDSGAGPVAVTAITIAPSSATIKVGKKVTLVPTITPSNATDKAVTWAVTSGSSYASVTDAGVVTGLAVGTAVVTATAHDGSGVTQTATITVEACPTSGTIYKFQLKTDLTNGNLTTSVPQDVVMTTENYLSNLTGGTLTAAARSNVNRINISNGNAIGFANGDQAFLKMDLDCAIQEGDILKYTITSNDMILMAGSETEATNRMTLSRNVTQVEVDSKLVGADALYMKRSSSSPKISYFEVFRPVYRTITLEYADGVTPDGTIKVLDGEAATKPSDPTWEHHRFAGWYNGSDPYDWSETVGGDLTLTAHWTQLYTITYAAGDGTATGDAPTQVDKAATETFTVAANSFAVAGKVFDYWNDGTNDYNPGDTYTVGTNNVTLTAVWRTPSTMYAITKGAHENGDFTIDPASQEAGEVVTLEATPDDGYLFGAWEVVKTEDASATGITVDANGQFTMPGYAVTVNATFVADPRKKVLYVTSTAEATVKENDKLYDALKDIYNVSIVGPTSEADQTNYDLVVLHESIGGSSYNAAAVAAAKTGSTPVLNTKSYFYNDGRFGWGAPNAGQSVKGATQNSAYCNIASHPLFDGLTITDGFFEITDEAAAKCMQPVGSFTSGKEGYTLATTPNNGEGNGCAIHELTPAQRGASAGKYLMISVSNAKLDALNANGQKLFQNAAAYLIGSSEWSPVLVPTTPEITGTTAYSAGETIELTASATGESAATTYTWYKGATLEAAKEAGAIQAAKTIAENGNVYSKAECVVGDAGTYWCVISNGTDCEANASVEITVSDASYNASFVSAHGTAPVATSGVSYTLPELTESGYVHQGWTANIDVTVDEAVVTAGTTIANGKTAIFGADVTFTAVWKQIFAVTFNLNGQSGSIAPQDIIDGEKATKPADPVVIGQEFGGWFTDAACTEGNEFDFNTPITKSEELFAKWTAFDGCALLYPSTTATAALETGDNVELVSGSFGGSIAIVGMKNSTSIAYDSKGLKMGGGSADIISVTLNSDMADGTKISVTLEAFTGGRPRGLDLLNATGGNVKGGTILGWLDDGSADLAGGETGTFTYVVEAEDGLEGKNVFRLRRHNSTYIKSIKVENCGAAITYHNLTSEVNIAGKGTVTLGATSVREGYTTTAEYSDIDPLYEFVNWTVSGAGASVENATANPATITVGTEDAVVTLNLRLIPVKFTVEYYDGATLMGSEQVAVNENPTASEIVTAKRHYTFLGWSDTDGGDVVALNTITRTEAGTVKLYAKYEAVVCPTSGTIFSMESDEAKKPGETVKVAKNGGSLDLAEYATISGGNATIANEETSDKDAISTSGQFLLKATKEVMKIELNCVLQEGDIIRIPDNNQKYVLSTSNAKTGTYQAQTSAQHDFAVTEAWVGVDDIYVLYDGSSLNFTKLYVIRPAKYTVSFNMMGHGTQIADIEDVLEGSKITAPSPAPTDADYSFAGWYKENTLSNEWDFDVDVVEANTTLYAKWLDKSDATLKSLKYGSEAIALEDGVFEYNIGLPAMTVSVPALAAVANSATVHSLDIADATAFDSEGKATSTVTVVSEDETVTNVYSVNFSKLAELPQVNVTEATTWDFSAGGSTTLTNQSDVVLANVPGINNDENFNSQALLGSFNKLEGTYFQGSKLSFTTEVAGKLTITFRGTNGNTRHLQACVGDGETVVADWVYNSSSTSQTKTIFVPEGKVTLKAFEGETPNNVRIYRMELNTTPNYTRDVTEGRYGTICLPNGGVMVGAMLYEVAYFGETSQKIFFDNIPSGEMEAGIPYIFLPNDGVSQLAVYYTDDANASAGHRNGLYGSYTEEVLTDYGNDYVLYNNQYLRVVDNGATVKVGANRAYIKLGEITPTAPALAPGRIRMAIGVTGHNTPTGLENGGLLNGENGVQKVLINGNLYILRGEKMFDATGRLVK